MFKTNKKITLQFPVASAISVIAILVNHSQPPPPQEALQDLQIGHETSCGHCGGELRFWRGPTSACLCPQSPQLLKSNLSQSLSI